MNSLLCMDNIKLFAKGEPDLRDELAMVKKFSDYTCIEFGRDKRAKVTFKRGKHIAGANITHGDKGVIKNLEQDEIYTYLRVGESKDIKWEWVKEKMNKEYYRREICS